MLCTQLSWPENRKKVTYFAHRWVPQHFKMSCHRFALCIGSLRIQMYEETFHEKYGAIVGRSFLLLLVHYSQKMDLLNRSGKKIYHLLKIGWFLFQGVLSPKMQ